jgi:hypothetical protein
VKKKQTGKIYFKDRDEEYSKMFKASTDTLENLSHRFGWPHTFDKEGKFMLIPLEDLAKLKTILKKWGIPFKDTDEN